MTGTCYGHPQLFPGLSLQLDASVVQQQWISHLSASKIYISVFLSLAWNLTGKILSKPERLVATICSVLRKALLFIATDNLARSPPSWAVRGLSGGRARCWRAAWSQPQPHHQAQPLPAARPLPQPCCSPHPQQDAKASRQTLGATQPQFVGWEAQSQAAAR